MKADRLYDLVAQGIIGQHFAESVTFDDRRLTFREWWDWKVRHKGDPRVHYDPIKIHLFNSSLTDILKENLMMICPECGDLFAPGDADDGVCPWDDSTLVEEDIEPEDIDG